MKDEQKKNKEHNKTNETELHYNKYINRKCLFSKPLIIKTNNIYK